MTNKESSRARGGRECAKREISKQVEQRQLGCKGLNLSNTRATRGKKQEIVIQLKHAKNCERDDERRK